MENKLSNELQNLFIMNPANAASMSASIAESMVETSRRQRATVTGGESTLDDESGYTRDFQAEDQKVCLWNLANTNLHPRSPYPAFRIMGLFADTETALAHAEQMVASDPSCCLRLVESHAWYTIPTDMDSKDDKVAKVNRNLLHHQNMLQDHASEFKQRHDALTKGRKPALDQAQAAVEQASRDASQREKRKAIYSAAVDQDDEVVEKLKEQYENEMVDEAEKEMSAQMLLQMKEEEGAKEEEGPKEEEGTKEEEYVEPVLLPPPVPENLNKNWKEKTNEMGGRMPPPVSRMVEVRNQRYAVVSVVNDYETSTEENPLGNEPGVIVWAAFETEAEALKYNKCVASKKLRDHDLAIVSMYEWLFPHMMNSDSVEQLYRNEELNNIMKHARTSSKQVRDFEDQCKREEVDVPTLSIEPDLEEAAPRKWVPPVGCGLEDGEEEEKKEVEN
jgi:hypothetical protein